MSPKRPLCGVSSPTGPPATVREICRSLNADRVPSPTGKATWAHPRCPGCCATKPMWGGSTSTAPNRCRIGGPHAAAVRCRVTAPTGSRSLPRIVTDEVFEAAGRVAVDNTQWSPRRAEPAVAAEGLVKCGACGVGTNCHKMRGRNGTWHRYYYCRNHDPLRAGGRDRRCPERNIRADALDEFVFDQIKQALLQPDLLLWGTHRRPHCPGPRRPAARRRTRPPEPQGRRRRRGEAPAGRPLPSRPDRAG